MSVQTIAVVGAMEQEIELLRESMANVKHVSSVNSRRMKRIGRKTHGIGFERYR